MVYCKTCQNTVDWMQGDPGDEHRRDFFAERKEVEAKEAAETEAKRLKYREQFRDMCEEYYNEHAYLDDYPTVNQEADKLVEGHRGEDYGHPSIDLGRTAKLWTALFDFTFTASDVAQAMRMVKESRLRNSPRHRDSLVDICGYARTQEMIWESESATE